MISPVKNLFIASEVRSGITWAGELTAHFLERHSENVAFGLMLESFRDLHLDSNAAQVNTIYQALRRDAGGLVSCKMQCASLSVIYRESLANEQVRASFFGHDTAWIVLRRKDQLRQAVSLAAARRSNEHHHYGSGLPDADLGTSDEDVNKALGAILRSDLFLATFAERIPSAKVLACEYAQVRRQPEAFLRSLFALCGWDYPQNVEQVDLTKLTPWADRSKAQAREHFAEWLLCNCARSEDDAVSATLALQHRRAQRLGRRDPMSHPQKRRPVRALFGNGGWLVNSAPGHKRVSNPLNKRPPAEP